MATKLYLSNAASDINPGSDDERLASLSHGSSLITATANGVDGPTAGVQALTSGITPVSWFTKPLKAVGISGTITMNLWMYENLVGANMGAQIEVSWYDNSGTVLKANMLNEGNGQKGTELPTSVAAQNWSVTPGSASLVNGDRLKIIVFVNDAGGNMSSVGPSWFNFNYGGTSDGADGDSWVQFTETIEEFVAAPRSQAVVIV